MKTIMAVLVLSVAVLGQNAPLTQQRLCAEQARQIGSKEKAGPSEIYFETNHFNSYDSVCYFVTTLASYGPSVVDETINISVENAFEGTSIACYAEQRTADKDNISTCLMRGRECKSKGEFDQLLKQVMYREKR